MLSLGCKARLMAAPSRAAPWAMTLSSSRGVTTRSLPSCAIIRVGMPAAITGRPRRAASRCLLLPGWAGQRPVSENCSVRPRRWGYDEQRLSTQMRAVGRTSRTSAPASCCRLRPVDAETPGATAATGRMPFTGGQPAPIVTKIFWTVRGPRASAVKIGRAHV